MALFKKKDPNYEEVASKARARAAELLREAELADERREEAKPPVVGVITAQARTSDKRTGEAVAERKVKTELELPPLPEKDGEARAEAPSDVLNAVATEYMPLVPVLGPNEAQALQLALLLALLDELRKK
jgi:hypothetical protein